MDKFIKRLQTRATRKGISVSKSQVREVYTQVVVTPESPTGDRGFFRLIRESALANESNVRRVAGTLSPRQKELAQQIAKILAEPSTTQEEKTKMLRALDSVNSFFESAINLLAFGKFRPTSFL